MTTFGWKAPTGATPAGRGRTLSEYEQIARGADQAGYDALHLPWSPDGDDPLVLAGIIARVTRRIRIVVELHPAAGSPVYIAKLLASLQRASGGRIDLALRDSPGSRFAHSAGDEVADAAARTAEFVTVLTGVWNEHPVRQSDPAVRFDHTGEHYRVTAGGLTGILSGVRRPTLYRSPGSEADPTLFDVTDAVTVPILARETAAEARADAADGADGLVGAYDEVIPKLRTLIDEGAREIVFTAPDPLDLFRIAEEVIPALHAQPASHAESASHAVEAELEETR